MKILFNKNAKNKKFNISGNNQLHNINLINMICKYLDKINREKNNCNFKYQDLIKFVNDRPGHDRKYFLNSKKIKKELNWKPTVSLKKGLKLTIDWYLNNFNWWKKSI